MKANYYIKTYQLSTYDTEVFLQLIEDEHRPTSDENIAAFAEHWIREIRPRCSDEVECRAVIFRKLMETPGIEDRPPGTTPMLAVAWVHAVTDAVHQAVSSDN